MDIQGIIWGVHGHKGGSSWVSMELDIQGGHLGCPWTCRGVIWGVHGHTGGSSGLSMDINGVIWVVKRKGAEGPTNGPKGPQPSAGTRNKRAKRAVFLV